MPVAITPDAPPKIVLTDDERDSVMSDIHLYDAIEGLYQDGCVVIENAIPHHVLDKLNARMNEDSEKLLTSGKTLHFAGRYVGGIPANVGGNLSQVMPLEKEYMFPEIYTNKHAINVLVNVIGANPEVRYMRSNTLLRTQEKQLVHVDLRHRYPVNHPQVFTCNITLIDVRPENGSTELWLGTQNRGVEYHKLLGGSDIAEWALEQRRKERPPIQPIIKKGSLVLRDLRLWHCGCPNPTDEIRHMLSLLYFPKWYKNLGITPMPESLKPTIDELEKNSGTKFGVQWVPDEGFDYLHLKFQNNFSSSLTPHLWDEVAKVSEMITAMGELGSS